MSTILVVEDSTVMQRIIGHTLRRTGHTIYSAQNGRAALEQLQKAAVDLIITDYSMPVMNGLELVQALRANPNYAHIPVIMLTGRGEDGAQQEAQAAGVNGFLTKPASSHQLMDAVNALLQPAS